MKSGGFEFGTTVLKVSGTVTSPYSSWFGLTLKTGTLTTSSTPSIWDGIPLLRVDTGGNSYAHGGTGASNTDTNFSFKNTDLSYGKEYLFEYILDTTQSETQIYLTMNYYTTEKVLIASKEGFLRTSSTGALLNPQNLVFAWYGDSDASTPNKIFDLSVSAYNIPEPSSIAAVFALTALGVVIYRRRK